MRCYFAPYENADSGEEDVETAVGVGLRCDKEGYFIVGLKMLDNTPAGEEIGTCRCRERGVVDRALGVRSGRGRRDDSREDEEDADLRNF